MFPSGARAFSTAAPKETGGSIFDEADFFEADKEIMNSIQTAEPLQGSRMPYFDSTDTFASLEAVIPKDINNVAQGVPTYGLFEYISFLDETFTTMWMSAADVGSMGLCWGLLLSTLATRMVFVPIQVYSQMVGHKMKLLAPDQEDSMNATKAY